MSYQRRRVRVGRVVSDSMDKTVVVVVEWKRPHTLYKKPVRRRSRMKAHDADNTCRLGDVVQIVESRPLSKTKKWRVKDILSRVEIAEIQPEEITVEEDVIKASVDGSTGPGHVDDPKPDAEADESRLNDGDAGFMADDEEGEERGAS